MKYLVTGAAGFIGFHVSKKLCEQGHQVVGIDNLNDYYDVSLKEARLANLQKHTNFEFFKQDITDLEQLLELFKKENFDRVIHLAAQAGVRYSIDNPNAYIQSNLVGHFNILESCRQFPVEHLLYASSSSVYGLNTKVPFSTDDKTDSQVSLYGATKKSNELMSHSYSKLYGIPSTGLRFFTVYGPWGRPDMAPFKFTKKILDGDSIDIYNNGDLSRDFTYIDDIVTGIIKIADKTPSSNNSESVPNRILNIGNGSPVNLLEFVETIERKLKLVADKNMLPMQDGDVFQTWADTKELEELINFKPQVNLADGISAFVDWYRKFYNI
ncbi:NAD-dependent epimerase [uncultured Psychrosphaera sp.]|jgi:UDP-glucuronate 4-epimerase|uniref:NAD-dependent epimerase n=1 Tax=uncultured Psychrosphaera sp. TaxID=1403522 RepID=UPI002608CCFF|nr:NAD-dependent epimerase [uncultured Psychrosphaera sp.]